MTCIGKNFKRKKKSPTQRISKYVGVELRTRSTPNPVQQSRENRSQKNFTSIITHTWSTPTLLLLYCNYAHLVNSSHGLCSTHELSQMNKNNPYNK